MRLAYAGVRGAAGWRRFLEATGRGAAPVLLPFDTHALFRSYLYSAYPAGLLASDERMPAGMLYGHLQLFFPDAKLGRAGRRTSQFRFFPGLGVEQYAALGYLRLTEHDAQAASLPGAALVGRALQCLDRGHYVIAFINEYFVPGTEWFLAADHRHPLLIRGYDRAARRLLGVTYRADGEFGAVGVPFSFFAAGVRSRGDFDPRRNNGRRVLQEIELAEPADELLDPELLAAHLADYAEGVDNSAKHLGGAFAIPGYAAVGWVSRHNPDTAGAFGMRIYPRFAAYLERCVRDREEIDMRATRVLADHKRVLSLGLARAGGGAEFAARCAELRRLAAAIHYNAFLWNRHRAPAAARKAAELLSALAAEEAATLSAFLARGPRAGADRSAEEDR